ncbi:MAG: hypothetical protein ACOYEB_03650 [Enterococcus lemanii]|jgi:hypothetical protein
MQAAIDFAKNYLTKKGYTVKETTLKENGVHILAQSHRTGKNETFTMEYGELKKLVHTGNKYQPWSRKTVARYVEPKSHLAEMKAAVNDHQSKQKKPP